jgi:Flp pilus assembly pilin Flp
MARPGQALVEYILMVAVVAIMLLVSLVFFRDAIASRLDGVREAVESPETGEGGQPPGQGGQPPGQGGQPPGQGGQPPGQGGQPPGQGGQPPGQGKK